MKTVLGCVWYADAETYFSDFVGSIIAQSDKEFDILIVLDDIDEIIARKYIDSSLLKRVNFVKILNRRPFELRVELINEAKQKGYDLLVILDVDDIMYKDRVRQIRMVASKNKQYSFFYNDIYSFDKKHSLFGKLPETIRDIRAVGEKNFLGMSNTSIALNDISEDFIYSLYEGDTNIFDWFLYSSMILEGYKGKYIKNAYTYYRLHSNNLVGIPDNSSETIEKELLVKLNHYALLKNKSSYIEALYLNYQKIKINDVVVKKKPFYWWNIIDLKNEIGG